MQAVLKFVKPTRCWIESCIDFFSYVEWNFEMFIWLYPTETAVSAKGIDSWGHHDFFMEIPKEIP